MEENNSKYVITPIAQKPNKYGPCSKTDWEEQQKRCRNGEQMMWDDEPRNRSKAGDFLFVWHYKDCVTIHNIEAVFPSSKRLPSWSDNVGQTDRQVLYISNEIHRIDWDEWVKIGGHKRCMGTGAVVTIAPVLRKILNDNTK
jgi:hypothetical protein